MRIFWTIQFYEALETFECELRFSTASQLHESRNHEGCMNLQIYQKIVGVWWVGVGS